MDLQATIDRALAGLQDARRRSRVTRAARRSPSPRASHAGGKLRHAPNTRLHDAAPWDATANAGRGGWQPFIRATQGRSGAYVIRPLNGDEPYIGSSNAGRLYRTMIRHFQEWDRRHGYDRHHPYNRSEEAPGVTFDRERVEVAVVLCAPADARALEADIMRHLRPRGELANVLSPEGEDKVPF